LIHRGMSNEDDSRWARSEFGRAELGDKRRTDRLVRVAASVLERPAGKVTEVFGDGADREAAFRLMQNNAVDVAALQLAARRACARRSCEFDFVFVPIDGSSLNLADTMRKKRLGAVGSRRQGAVGLEVMSAIAVSPQGVPLGICGQEYWARNKVSSKRKGRRDKRSLEEKESWHWLGVMEQVRAVMKEEAPKTRPWFQLDRGGDAWPVLLEGLEPDQLFTVRAAQNRRLWQTGKEREYLWTEIESAPVLGTYELAVPAGPNRQARIAHMEVRATEVTLKLQRERSKKSYPATLFAVMTREVSRVPITERPLEWLLLTTYEVHDLADAIVVIDGYAQRWRIEQFHRTWKSGACRAEDTQLGDRDHIIRWVSILASVAMRILRMTYLAREKPELPADIEFEREEIDAVILLRKPAGQRRGARPTIGELVRWIADLGGYTGKSSGGPPGAIVIRRGLERIQSAVEVLKAGDL